jgi:enoyl-CoA hydratase/carnithine racemase
MGSYNTVLYEAGGPANGVCRITLNRPEQRNAINCEMAEELLDALLQAKKDPNIRVIVLSGAGKSFCAGGDLSVLPTFNHNSVYDWMAHQGYEIARAIAENDKVVVAKVKGHCLAGGLELALACDLVYAAEKTKFGVTEITMGILPGWSGTARLARSMPIHRAKEILFTGRRDYSAREIYEMGLLTRVYADDELDAKVDAIVNEMAGRSADALRMGKSVLNRSFEGIPWDAAMTIERNAVAWLYHSDYATQLREFALAAINPPKG